jgi:hypothetical protein
MYHSTGLLSLRAKKCHISVKKKKKMYIIGRSMQWMPACTVALVDVSMFME